MSDALVQAIGWALVQFVWQGALIAGLTGVVLVAFRGAAARYIVATVGLAAMLAIALATTAWYARHPHNQVAASVDSIVTSVATGIHNTPAFTRAQADIPQSRPTQSMMSPA